MKLARGLSLALFLSVATLAQAVSQDEALRDRVAQLVERLDAAKKEARDTAEAALIGLGPRVLPFLTDLGKTGSADRKERLARIQTALREAQEEANLDGSKITMRVQGMRLSEILKKLQTQTGNTISDLREQYGADATNPSLDLDIADKPFLEALDQVARKTGIAVNYYTGDGSIGLMPVGNDRPAPAESSALVQYQGPFRIEAQQMTMVRNLQAATATASLRLEIAWEPRLRPMLLALKADDLVITDDQGNKIAPEVMEESTSVVLRPENPVAELNLNMAAPSRAAKTLGAVKVKADVTVPAAVKTFRFPDLSAKRVQQKQGDVAVTLIGSEIDEATWLVSVEVAYQGGGAAFESYQQGLFNNRVYLQKPDGSVFEQNGGFNQIGSGEGRVAFEYVFVDVPGKMKDYQLVYDTPSKVITIPLEFEVKDIPLP